MNLRAELAVWNTAQRRAWADYYRAPRRACFVEDCHNLHDDDSAFCIEHQRISKRRRKK